MITDLLGNYCYFLENNVIFMYNIIYHNIIYTTNGNTYNKYQYSHNIGDH